MSNRLIYLFALCFSSWLLSAQSFGLQFGLTNSGASYEDMDSANGKIRPGADFQLGYQLELPHSQGGLSWSSNFSFLYAGRHFTRERCRFCHDLEERFQLQQIDIRYNIRSRWSKGRFGIFLGPVINGAYLLQATIKYQNWENRLLLPVFSRKLEAEFFRPQIRRFHLMAGFSLGMEWRSDEAAQDAFFWELSPLWALGEWYNQFGDHYQLRYFDLTIGYRWKL